MENKIKKFISSTVSYHDFKEAINIANRLKTGIEISRFSKLSEIEENFEKNKKEYKAILNDFEGSVTLHGFFSGLSIASKDPLIKKVSYKRYYQSLELAETFDAETVVFHTCFNNLLKQKKYKDMFFISNIEFYNEFIKNFEDLGITATIENVHESSSDMIRDIIGAVNSPNLKATIDIGHCNLHSIKPVSNWIKDYGIMLHHMHFHNNFQNEDSHSSLLKGNLNIKEILQTLKDINLYPSVTFEIFNEEELIESIEYFDSLCDEIGLNYE